jgi:hypothetical protein
MKATFVALLFTILVLCTSGCLIIDGSDGTGSRPVEYRTTEDVYEPVIITGIGVFVSFEIAGRIRNTGDGDIAMIGCFRPQRPVLQKFVDGDWTTVYAVAEPECLSPPFYFGPGETYQDTLMVSAVLDPDVSPEAKWDSGIPVAGLYRLQRNIYSSEERSGYPQDLLPLADRVSEPFEIHPVYSLSNRPASARK